MPHPPHQAPPVISVSHLPSASSFYANLLQPLGVVYLSTTSPNPAYAASPCLHFGYLTPSSAGPRPLIIFSLIQAYQHPIRISHIIIPAQSTQQVQDVWKLTKALVPGSRSNSLGRIDEEGGQRTVTRDLDGNIIETIYKAPPYTRAQSPPRSRSEHPAHTLDLPAEPPLGMNPDKDQRRVLEWQSEVARSVSPTHLVPAATNLPIRIHVPRSEVSYREREADEPVTAGLGIGPGTFRRADTFPRERERERERGTRERSGERLVRRDTITTEHYTRVEHSDPKPSNGISGKAVLGTLLGAAAGAAFAYAMVRSESPDAEPARRRDSGKSFGSGKAYRDGAHYSHVETTRGIEMIDRERAEVIPARSYVHERGGDLQRGDREVRPKYVTYHVSVPPPAPSSRAHNNYAEVERLEHGSQVRRTSDVGSRYAPPLAIQSSQSIASRARSPSQSGKSRAHSPSRSHASYRSLKDPEAGKRSESRSLHEQSYTSARSQQAPSVISQSSSTASGSTLRAEQELLAKVPTPPSAVSNRSGTVRDSGRSHTSRRSAASKPRSTVYREMGGLLGDQRERRSMVSERSARDVPLPRSTVGYEYEASVAPSDSVSSVGSKRERERLRERTRDKRALGGAW